MARGFGVCGVVNLRLDMWLSKSDVNEELFGVKITDEIGVEDLEEIWFGKHLRKFSRDESEVECTTNSKIARVVRRREGSFIVLM